MLNERCKSCVWFRSANPTSSFLYEQKDWCYNSNWKPTGYYSEYDGPNVKCPSYRSKQLASFVSFADFLDSKGLLKEANAIDRLITAEVEMVLGDAGLTYSHQKEFPKETQCCKCGGTSRIGFVVQEVGGKGPFVCDLHENDPDGEGYWLHDACAVAIYFCKGCLETTALYNQG